MIYIGPSDCFTANKGAGAACVSVDLFFLHNMLENIELNVDTTNNVIFRQSIV